MGNGSWTSSAYNVYTTTTRGVSADTFATSNYTVQEVYKNRRISPLLDPKNVMRRCIDSEEHPNTFPVILALDVTGSMGDASMKVAQKLNDIMTDIYENDSIKDIEFCVMGIGDLAYDDAPIQISQFESDIRIAEQLDALYFEAGGGGNKYESYTAAWYMGVRHCDLDCWKRGKKGLIITMGDELPNPYLYKNGLINVTGDKVQDSIETKDLIDEVKEKYNIYHISVKDNNSSYDWNNQDGVLDKAWRDLLGDHYSVATLNNLAKTITEIIKSNSDNSIVNNSEAISW